MAQFAIYEENMERLTKKLTRIRNKCHKYGCDFTFREVGEEFREFENEDGDTYTLRYVLVEAEGTAKVNGWRFIATIDHSNESGNIIRKISGEVEVPERYYTCEPTCEHCNSKRHRKETYIVYNEETKEFKQVGSNCLCDFTGGYNAEWAAEYISLYNSLIEGEAPMEGCHFSIYWDTEEVLRYAVEIVNNLGYSGSNAWEYGGTPTRSDVVCAIQYDHRNTTRLSGRDIDRIEEYRAKFNPKYDTPELKEEVQKVLEYVKSMEETSDYVHNLKVLANEPYVASKNLGYLVSMVSCYNKHIEKVTEQKKREEQNAKEASVSNYIGKEKDRIKITNISVVTSWNTQYGITFRYKIIDTNGNVIMWDASSSICDMPVKSITGTIKKLDEFRGVKQTWITRCRVEYAEESKGSDDPKDSKSVDEVISEFLDFCNA